MHINYLEPIKPHFKAMPLVPKKHIQTRLGAAVPGKLFTSDPLCQKWSFGTNCIWKCLYHDCDIEFGIILYRHLYTKDISRFANRMHCTAATIFYNLGVWLDFSWLYHDTPLLQNSIHVVAFPSWLALQLVLLLAIRN